jgi:hypothetical protein
VFGCGVVQAGRPCQQAYKQTLVLSVSGRQQALLVHNCSYSLVDDLLRAQIYGCTDIAKLIVPHTHTRQFT